MRLAAKVLDERPDVGMVYAYGRFVGAVEGPWLGPRSLEEIIFYEGVPAPSMYRKKTWEEIGGYSEDMYIGREDWDFSLSVIERGYGVHALSETPGIYYRIKDESRSRTAEEHTLKLITIIYRRHRELFHQYPRQMAKMLYQGYHLRKFYNSEEWRTGYAIVRRIAQARDGLRKIPHFIKAKMKRKT